MLRNKIIFSVLLVVLLSSVGQIVINRALYLPFVNRLEFNDARLEGTRSGNALVREGDFLLNLCTDWAFWDDAYRFMADRNEEFIQTNLAPDTFRTGPYRLFAFFTSRLNLFFARRLEPDNVAVRDVDSRDSLVSHLGEILPSAIQGGQHTSFFDHEGHLYILAWQAVTPSENRDNPRGYLAMLREIDAAFLNELATQLQLPLLLVYPLKPPEFGSLLPSTGDRVGPDVRVLLRSPVALQVSIRFPGINRHPLFGLQYVKPRNIYMAGFQSQWVVLGVSTLTGLLAALVLWILLRRSLLVPLKGYADYAKRIIEEQDYGIRLPAAKNLEFKGMVDAMNQLLSKVQVRTQSLEEDKNQLEEVAATDALTGLANRRAFDDRLDRLWAQCTTTGRALALILVDVDFFKRFNDHYGHLGGDACLQAVAEILRNSLRRPEDFVCRYGGEEFAILLPGSDKEGARVIASRIKDAFTSLQISHKESPLGIVTVSMGIAVEGPETHTAIKDFIDRADQNLYAAKKAGRNRFEE